MYSNSIRERQQELLDVLFKKANCKSKFGITKQAWGVIDNTKIDDGKPGWLTTEALADRDRAGALTRENGYIPQYAIDVIHKVRNMFSEELKREDARQDTSPNSAKTSKSNWSDIKRVAGQLRAMTGLDVIPGVVGRAHDSMTPIMAPIMTGVRQSFTAPAGSQPESANSETPETPTNSTPEGEGTASPETPATPEGGGSTPSTPKPVAVREAEQAARQGQKTATPGEGGGATDWNKVVNGLLERVKRHKLMGLGGLGGAGLGALLGGGSFTDRLLWALLGGGAGTGLGYLAEKYLK